MNRAERMAAGRETRGRNLRWMASAAMIAVAVIVGASASAASAGLSPIDAGRFQPGSTDLPLVSISAHLMLAAAVAVQPPNFLTISPADKNSSPYSVIAPPSSRTPKPSSLRYFSEYWLSES